MSVINKQDKAPAVISKLRNAFGSGNGIQEVSVNDNATDFVDKVNHNFEWLGDYARENGIFPANTVLQEDIGSLNAGEDIGGMSIADFITYGLNGSDRYLRFLHLSDPHGETSATTIAKNMMTEGNQAYDESIAFTIITGDLCAYNVNAVTDGLKNDMAAFPTGGLLLLPGNHDTYDNKYGTSSVGQEKTTNFLKGYMDGVEYGDQSGKGCYWYKDYMVGTAKVRVIAIDQYEIDAVRKPSSNYIREYSQAQVDWFIARIKELEAGDCLIVALHTVPIDSVDNPDTYATGLRPTQPYFEDGVLREPEKLFMSEKSGIFTDVTMNAENLNLIPRIIDAYINRRSCVFNFTNYGGNTASPDIVINEDFTESEGTFLFYLFGHQHSDRVAYMPDESGVPEAGDFRQQLLMGITAADRSVAYAGSDDLGGNGSSAVSNPSAETYRINMVELDFAKRRIKVTRIGDKNTYGGRIRDHISFPFVREINNQQ